MTTPYYDARTKQNDREFVTSQYWKAPDGWISNRYSMRLNRTEDYQFIESYRGEINGSLGIMARGKQHPVALRRMRQLNPHPVIMRKYHLESTGGTAVCKAGSSTTVLKNGLAWGVLGQHYPSTGFVDRLDYGPLPVTRAYQTALAKQDPMMLDLSSNLGELNETISMLRSPLRGINTFLTEMFSAAKRGRRGKRSLANFYEALTSTWLEYRYGIMPLIYTSVDLMSIAEKQVWDGFKITKGSHKPRVVESPVTVYDAAVGDFVVNFNHQRIWENRAVVIITAMPNYTVTLQDVLGIHPTNIPLVALELTRLSFVLEWFVDVSGWLRQLIPFENRFIHSVQLCEKRSVKDIYTERFTYCLYGQDYQACSGATVTSSTDMLTRTIQPEIPVRLELGSGVSNIKRLLDSVSLGLKPGLQAAGKLLSKARRKGM